MRIAHLILYAMQCTSQDGELHADKLWHTALCHHWMDDLQLPIDGKLDNARGWPGLYSAWDVAICKDRRESRLK